MSDPNSTTSQPTNGPTPGAAPSGDWREQRRAERHARRNAWREGHHESWGGLPMGGIIILIVGVIFLANNFGFHLPANWWAVFVLVPAVAALVTAIRFYRVDKAMSARVMGSATGGVLMLAIALALFFGVNWGMFWPVILIIIGGGIVLRGYWR